MRQRKRWLESVTLYMALWWVPVGELPSIADAEARLALLREHGPTPQALSRSVADKRTLLDQLRGTPLQLDKLANWTTPRSLDLEWFASPNDLCHVLQGLASRAQFDTGSELPKILAINPGVAVDPAKFRYVGYKGGSEPGVLNLSWLAQRADGRWFVVVVSLNDKDKAIDENTAVQLAGGVLKLLGDAQ